MSAIAAASATKYGNALHNPGTPSHCSRLRGTYPCASSGPTTSRRGLITSKGNPWETAEARPVVATAAAPRPRSMGSSLGASRTTSATDIAANGATGVM